MSDTLQDRIAAGLGHAARRLGVATDAFRASSAIAPLALRNRFLRLPAALTEFGDLGEHRTQQFLASGNERGLPGTAMILFVKVQTVVDAGEGLDLSAMQ